MKVLVTGGAGFIGTNLVKRLLKGSHRVYVLDNYSTGFKTNQIDGALYYDIDIAKELAKFDENIDVIFHMAALPRINPSFKNPSEVCQVNVMGTLNILELARNRSVPVIYAGTSSHHSGVYKNPYTFSKWQGEELCQLYEKIYKVKITICRFYNVYGDHMPTSGGYRTVLPIFLEQHRKGLPLTITGNGEQRRDFTHVDDIVDAMMKCVEKRKYGFTFELGRGQNHSINEVVQMIGGEKRYIDAIPGEAWSTQCQSDLAERELGWKPAINLKDWLESQI